MSEGTNIKKCVLLIEPTEHHEVLDSYISIFHDLGYKVFVCSSYSNKAFIPTNQEVEWIELNDYKSINKIDPYFTIFITYHHSIRLYLKELNCAIGLVIHNANYLFDINQSTTIKGVFHQLSEKLIGISRLKKDIRGKINFLIARSPSMKNYVQDLTDITVICIPDIYIKAYDNSTTSIDQRSIITHIGRIDQNLKNIQHLETVIRYIKSHPREISLNIIGNYKSRGISPEAAIKVYDDYISSELLSKLITESSYILFIPNKEIRVRSSVERVGYSHIPGAIHDAARHMRHILTPAWYPKDDLLKDLIIPYENSQGIIEAIIKKDLEIRFDQKQYKQKLDHSLMEADKILFNIISNQ